MSRTNRVKRWFIYVDRRKHRSEFLDMLDVFITYCAELFDYMLFRQGKGDEEMAIPTLEYQQTLNNAIASDNRPSLAGRVKATFLNWTQKESKVSLSCYQSRKS